MKRLVLSLSVLVMTPVCCAITLTTPASGSGGGDLVTLPFGGAQPPVDRTVEPSQEALDSFDQEWQSAVLGPPGDFTMTFSEAELTSALWDSIAQMEAETGEDIPISDTQVFLQDGTLYIYGAVDAGAIQSDGLIAAQPSVGPDGTIDIAITSVNFGVIQMSQADVDVLEAEVESALNDWAAAYGATVTGVAITDGQFIVTGSTGR
jgi:hypothetical protein